MTQTILAGFSYKIKCKITFQIFLIIVSGYYFDLFRKFGFWYRKRVLFCQKLHVPKYVRKTSFARYRFRSHFRFQGKMPGFRRRNMFSGTPGALYEKNAVIIRIKCPSSSIPISSRAECMARIGTPISTVFIGSHEEMIGPNVPPPAISA